MNVGKRPGIRTILLTAMLAVLATAAVAQTQTGVAGKWRTESEGPGGKVIMIMQLDQDATGRWTGTVKSSTDRDKIDELKAVKVDGDAVSFYNDSEYPGSDMTIRATFALKLRPAENKLKGTVEVDIQGMKREMPVEFTRVVEKAGANAFSFQAERPVLGAWAARPDKDDKERFIQIEIQPDGDNYRGTLTDTGTDATVALRDLFVNDDENSLSFNFRFEGAPFMSSFWGRYNEERDRLQGSMSIGGRSQRMVFERTSPGPDSITDEFATDKKPLAQKHFHKFAVVAHGSLWNPLYVLKEKERNINDITTSTYAFDVGVRYHLLDYVAVQARYVHGGVGFDTNETNLGLFDPVDGAQGSGINRALNTDSYMKMDGYEFSVVGYLGQSLFPQSRFNPYIMGIAGMTDWAVTEGERGTEPIAIFEEPLEGSDYTFGLGLGTEYAVSNRFGLEFEWNWAYTLTEDEELWSDVKTQWSNQHVYRFSVGGIFWF